MTTWAPGTKTRRAAISRPSDATLEDTMCDFGVDDDGIVLSIGTLIRLPQRSLILYSVHLFSM